MRLRFHTSAIILVLAGCLPFALYARSPKDGSGVSMPAFMNVQLDAAAKFSHLKPGDSLQGRVTQNVFSGYRLMVPSGSQVYLTVSGVKRGPKIHNSLWPWPAQYFRPKYEKLPSFDFADVTLPDGKKVRLRVSAVSGFEKTEVALPGKHKRGIKSGTKSETASEKSKGTKHGRRMSALRFELVVRAKQPEVPTASAQTQGRSASDAAASLSGVKTISAGSKAKLALLSPLSASKSRAGELFKAVLVQPMRLDTGELLPEGTVFEGRVTRSVPPRWLSRPGSLYVNFTRLVLPAEANLPIAASVAGVDVSKKSRLKLNSEGGMRGGSPGKARLLLDLGVSYGFSKVADDGYQLITEALVSTATDASTAGTARLIGFAVTGLYMLTRHGQDVTLPRYTTITIRFDRPPSLPSPESVPQREASR